MTHSELLQRLTAGEDLHTEFKLQAIAPEDLAAAIVAFANSDGGEIIFGVSDQKNHDLSSQQAIVGIREVDKFCQYVDNVAQNNCVPPVSITQKILRIEDSTDVVIVNVARGEQRPYRTNKGIYYVRKTSGRRQASREELLRLFQAAESLFYDETPMMRVSVNDLDLEAFQAFRRRAESSQASTGLDDVRLLRNWRLANEQHPTIAGVVLFAKQPQLHLPFAYVAAVRTPGNDVANEPLDRKDLTGNLLQIIDQTMRFLNLHLLTPHEIRGLQPEQRPELPPAALREAIVNTVAHRDYTIQGPTRVFVFDDRVEFRSPGKAPNSLDVDAMRSGAHVVRNPHIYARLSDIGLVTGAGTGIPRIIKLVRDAVGRDVLIENRESEVLLVIPRRVPPGSK